MIDLHLIVLDPEVKGAPSEIEGRGLSIAAEDVSILKEEGNPVFVWFHSAKEELKLVNAAVKPVDAQAAPSKITSAVVRIQSTDLAIAKSIELIVKSMSNPNQDLIPRTVAAESA